MFIFCANPISVFLCQVVCIFAQIPSLNSWTAKSDARRCSWPRKSAPVSNVALLTCQAIEEYNNQYNNSTITLFSDPHNFYNSCVTSDCLFTFLRYTVHILFQVSQLIWFFSFKEGLKIESDKRLKTLDTGFGNGGVWLCFLSNILLHKMQKIEERAWH